MKKARKAKAFVVGADARWLRLPSGAEVEIHHQRALRGILLALARERIMRPEHALTWDRLFAHGWPGERVRPDAGNLRVRVTISRLRTLGLRDIICSRDDGYLLRADAPVVLQEAVPSTGPTDE